MYDGKGEGVHRCIMAFHNFFFLCENSHLRWQDVEPLCLVG